MFGINPALPKTQPPKQKKQPNHSLILKKRILRSSLSRQILKLEKTAKGWQLIAPKAGPANEGTVTFLLNLLATGTSEQTLQVEPAQLKEFGLEPPTTILALELKNQKSYQVNLGKQNFNQSAVYAQIDKNAAVAPAKESLPPKREIVLVPTGFLDAVNRPLSEWQAKTSSSKPTVSPSPSATPK
jgi:hypothetical protein